MLFLVTYDIADGKRRQRVSTLLETVGPRVQLSVFEADVDTTAEAQRLVEELTARIDADEDQIRIYRLANNWADQRQILGNRRLQESVPFLLL